jgi:hypothetical protein
MTKPEHLDTERSAALTAILPRRPELRAVRRHVAALAAMMGELLDSWMHAMETDDLPALHTLVARLRRDHAAVRVTRLTSSATRRRPARPGTSHSPQIPTVAGRQSGARFCR